MKFLGVLLAACVAATCYPSVAQQVEEVKLTSAQARKIVAERSVPFWTEEVRVWSSYKPKEAEQEFWNTLDSRTDFKSGAAPIAAITSPSSVQQVEWSLNWLKKQILSGKGDARFSYVYALTLSRMYSANPSQLQHLRKLAFVFLANARVMGRVETAACKDQRAGLNMRIAVEGQAPFAALLEEVRKTTLAEWVGVDLEVAGLQMVLGEGRIDRSYLCQMFSYGNAEIDSTVDANRVLRASIESLLRDRP